MTAMETKSNETTGSHLNLSIAVRSYYGEVLKMYSGIKEWVEDWAPWPEKYLEGTLRGIWPDSFSASDIAMNQASHILGKQLKVICDHFRKDYCFFEPEFYMMPDDQVMGYSLRLIGKKRYKAWKKEREKKDASQKKTRKSSNTGANLDD